MKSSISILGRKCDIFILLGITALTVFITSNTICNCKKCKEKCNNNGCCKKSCLKKTVRFAPNVKGHNDEVYNQVNYF